MHKEKENYNINFRKGLYKSLLKYFPPKKNSPLLEDITNILINGVEEGQLYIEINNDKSLSIQSSYPGWPEKHIAALKSSGWLEGNSAPIILRENKLSWSKWDFNMQRVINELTKRSSLIDKQSLYSCNDSIKIRSYKKLSQEQEKAVEAITKYGVILISGGPGTGKTSTIATLLERAVTLNSTLRIGLAAPTGKATRRLKESLQEVQQTIEPFEQQILSNIPCKTLHSWLQAMPKGYGKNKKNPITLDIMVIDEMSMVDIELMQALLNALPQKSQLVLVGDPEQLPPINSGAVWHQLQQTHIKERFGQAAIHLNKIYRNKGELVSLNQVLREKGLERFWERANQVSIDSNFERYVHKSNEIPKQIMKLLDKQHTKLKQLAELFHKVNQEEIALKALDSRDFLLAAEKLLSQLDELMVLCPKRKGVWGVNHIHKSIMKDTFEKDIDNWAQGTPVMCGENQPELGLANGDIGILVGEVKRKIIFRTFAIDGRLTYQLVHPARLKRIEPAFALTIHKAQGSEAKKVALLWPNSSNESSIDKDSSLNDLYEKRLLYTAITRAKESILLLSKY